VVIDTPPPIADDTSSTANTPSLRTPNRRHRSQHHNKPPTSAPVKLGPDKLTVPDSRPARARKPRPGPLHTNVLSKDTPPHLSASAGPESSTFDIRTDIDALVERVRAVAMAENRPTTPGSHIDWAGDEDDTLPDLDDWGVTTGLSPSTDTGEDMSPISVDGLTPLPEPNEQSLSLDREDLIPSFSPAEVTERDTPEVVITVVGSSKEVSSTSSLQTLDPSTKSSLQSSSNDTAETSVPRTKTDEHQHKTEDSRRSAIPATSSDMSSSYTPASSRELASATEYKAPLHPSLPPKPVAAVESLLAQSRARAAVAVPFRAPIPVVPATPAVKVIEAVITPAPEQSPKLVTEEETRSVSTPNLAVVQQELVTKPLQGLSASVHAPKNLPDSSSAPNPISSYLNPTAPNTFYPTHNRSHTLGRSPQAAFPSITSQSGNSTPRGRFSPSGFHHTRTHSSPAATMNNRPHHTTRPIITGDAISRLAKTICGVPPT
jgi:hypothetical protein